MTFNLKQLFTIALLLFIFSCTSDQEEDVDSIQSSTKMSISDTEIYTLEMVEISISDDVELQDIYSGTFGGNEIALAKVDESTLSFLVPHLESSTYLLECDFGTLQVPVIRSEIETSKDDIIKYFEELLDSYSMSINSEGTLLSSSYLSKYYNSISEEEKEEVALYLQSNKLFFESLISLQLNDESSTRILNDDFLPKEIEDKFRRIVANYGKLRSNISKVVSNFKTIFSGPIGAVFTIIQLTTLVDRANQIAKDMSDIYTKSIDSFYNTFDIKLDNETYNANRYLSGLTLSFIIEEEKSITIYKKYRPIQQSDRYSSNEVLSSYFVFYDEYITIIENLNSKIYNVNKDLQINIPVIHIEKIPEEAEVTQVEITESDYNNYTFSTDNVNLSVSSQFKGTGKVGLTISKIDNVNMSINEGLDFNIKINLKDIFEYSIESKVFDISECSVLPINTIAFWSFNGNTSDITGNGYNGIISNASLTTDRNSRPNNAYLFGANKYIEISNGNNMNSFENSISISCWIKPDDSQGLNTILSKWPVAQETDHFGIWLSNMKPVLAIGHPSISVGGVTFNYTLKSDEWYFLTFTWINGIHKLYVNGELKEEINHQEYTKISTSSDGDLFIGNDGENRFFHGVIDGVGIYNSVLSNSEIQELYNCSDY
ncbi:LamG domain-containing protein [Flammeovirga aprica]|uniref:LamG domain-containing protein n=1 Tax=Flammeovirga aprica JL-4 TaxID=694437 RepID=A0A7X9XBB8_9BACT|nr:LamG domain-containing protein [Flammeovirga aprica]NME70572.1 LamG domain-containing protein [Flammeovirga aprica JL-4]